MVTGAGSGIGAAIAQAFDAEGASVAVVDINAGRAAGVAETLGRGAAYDCDVSEASAVADCLGRIASDMGVPDVVVNNAGIGGSTEEMVKLVGRLDQQAEEIFGTRRPPTTDLDITVELTDEAWRRVMAVNLDGPFFVTREALRLMIPLGRGSIVNIASVCGVHGCVGAPAYSASKGGLLAFTRSVAKEVARQGIRINAVAPGYIDTAFSSANRTVRHDLNNVTVPLGRLGTPAEVAAAVLFLASDEAAFFVGATLEPNGGLLTA